MFVVTPGRPKRKSRGEGREAVKDRVAADSKRNGVKRFAPPDARPNGDAKRTTSKQEILHRERVNHHRRENGQVGGVAVVRLLV